MDLALFLLGPELEVKEKHLIMEAGSHVFSCSFALIAEETDRRGFILLKC